MQISELFSEDNLMSVGITRQGKSARLRLRRDAPEGGLREEKDLGVLSRSYC